MGLVGFVSRTLSGFSTLAGLILLALGLKGADTGLIPWYGWTIILLLVAITLAQFDNWSLRRRAQPLLKLSDPVGNTEQWRSTAGFVPGTLHRVKVTNIGTVAASRVEVRVTESRPPIRHNLATWLHQTDDNRDCFMRELELPTGEDSGRWIDTFFSIEGEGRKLRLYHAISPDWDDGLPEEHYVVKITASAVNAKRSCSEWYEVGFDEQNSLTMAMVRKPPKAASETPAQAPNTRRGV